MLPHSDVAGVVLDIGMMRNNTVLVFASADGLVIFFDRFTSQPVIRNPESPTIRTMFEAGFGFPMNKICESELYIETPTLGSNVNFQQQLPI